MNPGSLHPEPLPQSQAPELAPQNALFALPPPLTRVSPPRNRRDNCRGGSEAVPGWPPKLGGLTPRADDSAGSVPPASRWSTTAPSEGTRRSCGRWQPAGRCPGPSPPCLCSTCAQASGCLPGWTAPKCPSSWTSAEGRPGGSRRAAPAAFLGTRWPLSPGGGRWRGIKEVKGGTPRPAHPLRPQGGAARQGQVQAHQCQARVVRVSGWGRPENQGLGLTTPHCLPAPLFQLQPWPPPPPALTHGAATTRGHILPPGSGSWSHGLQAWNKQWVGVGGGCLGSGRPE